MSFPSVNSKPLDNLNPLGQGLPQVPQNNAPSAPQVPNTGSLNGLPVQQLKDNTSPLNSVKTAAQQTQNTGVLSASVPGLPQQPDLSTASNSLPQGPNPSSNILNAGALTSALAGLKDQSTALQNLIPQKAPDDAPGGAGDALAKIQNVLNNPQGSLETFLNEAQSPVQNPQGAFQAVLNYANTTLTFIEGNLYGAPTPGGQGLFDSLPVNAVENVAYSAVGFVIQILDQNMNAVINEVDSDANELGIPVPQGSPINSQLGGQVLQVAFQVTSLAQGLINYINQLTSIVPVGNLPA